MSRAYMRGLSAGRRGVGVADCPYEGHNDSSLARQIEWLNGRFDAITAPVPVIDKTKKKVARVPLVRQRAGPRVPTRWPRSRYARNRILSALAEQGIPPLCRPVGDPLRHADGENQNAQWRRPTEHA